MVSTAKISVYLEKLQYPATKKEIINYAQSRGATGDVIRSLDKMRGGKFYTLAGIWDAVESSS